MAEFQTTVTPANLIRGNGLVQFSPYVDGEPDWAVSAGAITDLAVEPDFTLAAEEFDNADKIESISKWDVKLSFTFKELLNLDAWEVLYGSLIDVSVESDETTISGGHNTQIPYFMAKITTLNDGSPVYFTLYKCNLITPFALEYKKDDGDDRIINSPVEIMGKTDPYRAGKVWELKGAFNG